MDYPDLEALSQAVGYANTRKIQAWYGGRCLWVPPTVRGDHPLVRLVGLPKFRRLVEQLGGERLVIPDFAAEWRYYRDAIIAEQLAQGLPPATVARAHQMSTRRIEQIRRSLMLDGALEFAVALPKGRTLRCCPPPALMIR